MKVKVTKEFLERIQYPQHEINKLFPPKPTRTIKDQQGNIYAQAESQRQAKYILKQNKPKHLEFVYLFKDDINKATIFLTKPLHLLPSLILHNNKLTFSFFHYTKTFILPLTK